ncbi:MAG TPA: adenylate/guanylate cyclase domain-containing protein [Actinomycetota bacterium]|nr:adenylate/guanylate cyclase domain-containing protein [Actinomycetota bacterium]
MLLHALATPGVLVSHPNLGFDISQPVGLAIAAVFAFASSLPLDSPRGARVARAVQIPLAVALGLLVTGWAAVMLLDLPPLDAPPQARDIEGPLLLVAVAAVGLFAVAALRYYLLHRRRPAAMLISIVTAFALLAEAMLAIILAHKWHLSWWEWHVLLALAFGFVAYSAYVQYRREGSSAGLFDAIALAETTRAIRREYAAALEDLVTTLQARERGGADPGPVAERLAQRFDLTEGQAAVLDRAGVALAAERDFSARLAALVAVGEQARIGLDEEKLLRQALRQVAPAYGDVRLGLISGGALAVDGRRYDAAVLHTHPIEQDGRVAYPLTVKGRVAGVLELPGGGRPRDHALAQTLANQLSIALENARLYRELRTLFRHYLSPDVADALLADPDQASLGGSLVEVTALFADLRGFTAFSEGVAPAEIVRMLNRYHGAAVPRILDNGGTVVQFVGDALLALFNAPVRQPDHALRAVRAALAIQDAVTAIAEAEPDWPRFRIGANTGSALVGNIGSDELRGFNAMGDAVNVAARLQSLAEPGQVVIGEATRCAVGAAVEVEPLGDLAVKGRLQTVRAYAVTALTKPAQP